MQMRGYRLLSPVKKTLLSLCLLCLVTACASAEEREQERVNQDIEQCTGRGLQPTSPEFAECRTDLQAAREQRKAARMSAFDTRDQTNPNSPEPVNTW